MASIDYTVDGMVTSVFRNCTAPASQNLFQNADIVAFLNEALSLDMVPVINSVREEYWVTYYDTQVDGRASYNIPTRAAGSTLRDAVFVDPAGNELDLQRLQPEHIKATFPFGFMLPLYTFGYFVKNDQLFLYPPQAQNATQYKLRQKALRRPNVLTLQANCGQITNINGNAVTLANVDSTWTTATTFDIIANTPPFNSQGDDLTITSIVGSVVTFTALPTSAALNMWVCPAGMSCVAQIPYEAYPLLIKYAERALFRALGDTNGIQNSERICTMLEQNLVRLIDNRVQGGVKKVINRNNVQIWRSYGPPFMR